jgi:subtilisin family serine protease
MRVLTLTASAVIALAFAGTAQAQRYVVLYRDAAPAGLAEVQVSRAGGSAVATYGRIGVVVAESSNPDFEASIERFRQVKGAVATAAYPALAGTESGGGPSGGRLPNEPASDADTFSGLQWGLDQIHAKKAHAVTGGSRGVLVGVIDTGIDTMHPDLDGNIDAQRSVSCVGGAPNSDPAAWDDDSGHGTSVSGIIAAESNGTGIVGVAPNVRIAAIKASVRAGTRDVFLPEAVICAFVWAGTHDVDVANNSYSVDSTIVNGTTSFCRADDDQSVVIEAVRRAVRFARTRGTSVVASAGNSNADMAADPCLRLPSELRGVITVAATGLFGERTAYSNLGLGIVDVAAPGGALDQGTPPSGLVLGTWPAEFQVPRLLCDPPASVCPPPGGTRSYYRFVFGTSEAAAHVSGVAALVVSRHGRAKRARSGYLEPRRVERVLERTADTKSCPPDPRCRADRDENGFYGHGIVNALKAVTLFGDRDDDDRDDEDDGDGDGRDGDEDDRDEGDDDRGRDDD